MADMGKNFGRYNLVRRIAVGGMSEVFLAKARGAAGFERPVVIKRVLPHLARSGENIAALRREAMISAQIRHPNVVQVLDLGHDEGEFFLVMEYLEGETLAGLMRQLVSQKITLPYELAAYLIAEACAGVHAAHELKSEDGKSLDLVHRDVSPQNIFLTYSGEVKVLDFGIAKVAYEESYTRTGQVKGKYAYFSPEQCRASALDRRSDLFAMGVVLYEASLCRRLFQRENELLVLKAICEEPIVSPTDLRSDYPDALAKVAMRALEKCPRDRYQSADAMRQDLLTYVHNCALSGAPRDRLSELMRSVFSEKLARGGTADPNVRLLPTNPTLSASDLNPVTPALIRTGDAHRKSRPPTAETVDVSVDRRLGPASDKGNLEPATRRKPVASWMVAVGVLLAISVVGVVLRPKGTRSQPQTSAIPAEAPAKIHVASDSRPHAVAGTDAGAAPPDAQPRVDTAAQKLLTIISRPAGAAVQLDGQYRGLTPLRIRLRPTQATPIRLDVSQARYLPVRRQIVPATAGPTLRLVLRRRPRAPKKVQPRLRPSPKVPIGRPNASTKKEPESFHRFD